MIATRAKPKKPGISAVVPYFGSNRMLAAAAGEELAGCPWVGIPFCGSLPELVYINARTVVVGDIHPHLINLLKVLADRSLNRILRRQMLATGFHAMFLKEAQERCRRREDAAGALFSAATQIEEGTPPQFEKGAIVEGYNGFYEIIEPDKRGMAKLKNLHGGRVEEFNSCNNTFKRISLPDVQWAADYFICSWMARSACAGTKGEFSGDICTRWEAGGGDSATRFHSAAKALHAWQRIMQRCTFEVLDVFAFIKRMMQTADRIAEKAAQVADPHIVEHGLYLDPPFPGPGDAYKFSFTLQQHRELARVLTQEVWGVRIVCRFYDIPLIRELYPQTEWTYRHLEGGRKQTNDSAPEILLVRGGPGGVK